MTTNIKLTGKKKLEQVRLLREMDSNLNIKPDGWESLNAEISEQIAGLFGKKAYNEV